MRIYLMINGTYIFNQNWILSEFQYLAIYKEKLQILEKINYKFFA